MNKMEENTAQGDLQIKSEQHNLMILEFDLVFLFTTKVKNTMFQNLQVVL
jgi:hypothetical protein